MAHWYLLRRADRNWLTFITLASRYNFFLFRSWHLSILMYTIFFRELFVDQENGGPKKKKWGRWRDDNMKKKKGGKDKIRKSLLNSSLFLRQAERSSYVPAITSLAFKLAGPNHSSVSLWKKKLVIRHVRHKNWKKKKRNSISGCNCTVFNCSRVEGGRDGCWPKLLFFFFSPFE